MNLHKKVRAPALLLALLLLFGALPLRAAAAGSARLYFENGKSVAIKTQNGEDFVSLYASALALCGSGKFDGGTRTMNVQIDGIAISARSGASFLTANGETIAGSGNYIASNVLYVPVSSLAAALGKSVESVSGGKKLTEKPQDAPDSSPSDDLDPDCVLWLARIIYCESRGQPFEGQVAVGSVVLNRVDSPEFPHTIFSVIFDRKYGVQFTPAGTGAVWCTPDDTAIEAAKVALRGDRTDFKILYFMNADLASSTWISDNRPFAFKIGEHSFYY